MYRAKIRDNYERLSRSYRKVADYILSNYYEVSFMTAAQLASVVEVDTTTVVRFSQRLGYDGYPELLADIREQVKGEIYASYEPKEQARDSAAARFKERAQQEQRNLNQMLVHNPPEHIEAVAELLQQAEHLVFVAEGHADAVAQIAAELLRLRGRAAEAVAQDMVKRAATLVGVGERTLVVGISATEYGEDVARALQYARDKGCRTLGVVGSLTSPVHRMADLVVHAPTDGLGPLPSVVALVAAVSALVEIATEESPAAAERRLTEFRAAYYFLTQRERPEESLEEGE